MLSKSKFIRGNNCAKSLWLYTHKKEEQLIDDATATIFSIGTDTGERARDFFPGGTLAVLEDWPCFESARRTQKLIKAGVETIYEATFIYDNTLVAVDILTKADGQWKLYEMKSTNSVKEPHVLDVAVQYYVVNGSGLPLADASVMHMNRDYVRRGPLDVQQLFMHESVLDQVLELQDYVKNKIPFLLQVAQTNDEPMMAMGTQCTSPYACDFGEYCSRLLPAVPQADQTTLSNVPEVNHEAVREFLDSIPYPLYFLDFETIMPCVPMFDESRPYQPIAFQYSLHYRAAAGADLEHYEYLADNISDPRIGLIQSLIANTQRPGLILVYNIGFERSRLTEMQSDFPQYADALENIIDRLVDLMPVFRSGHVITESMQGSYSIKAVLPALCPELSYDELEIQDGGSASSIFMDLYSETNPELISKTRADLLEYCKMDTMAMVRIVEVVEKVVVE